MTARRLRDSELALARIAWACGSAQLSPGEFRLLVNEIIDMDDIKVTVIRFAAEKHFATENSPMVERLATLLA